jgi:hypothetical protein
LLATPPNDPDLWISSFRDSLGNRRPCDQPMLAGLLGRRGVQVSSLADVAAARAAELDTRSPDAALWWLLHDAHADPRELIAPASNLPAPLFPRLHAQAIEMWTEAELSGLHALSWHARRDASLVARCEGAARWLIAELQPDNATNRPWAVHVIVDLSLRNDLDATLRADASMYAQTLFHNCQVSGAIDRFCACILLDAADALTQDGARPHGRA